MDKNGTGPFGDRGYPYFTLIGSSECFSQGRVATGRKIKLIISAYLWR